MFDPEKIATAIIQAGANIAARNEAAAKVNPTLAGILKSAGDYLKIADEALEAGEIQTCLVAVAASDSACRLVDMLITDPHDPEACRLAAPWSTEVAA